MYPMCWGAWKPFRRWSNGERQRAISRDRASPSRGGRFAGGRAASASERSVETTLRRFRGSLRGSQARTSGQARGHLNHRTPRSDLFAALDVLVAEADLVAQPHQRVVLAVDDAFLHRD